MTQFAISVRAIVIYERKLLLLRRAYREQRWEFPGGFVEVGESLPEALSREVREETGLALHAERLLYALTMYQRQDKPMLGLVYQGYADSDAVRLSEEHTDFLWATRAQMEAQLHEPMRQELIEHHVLDILDID